MAVDRNAVREGTRWSLREGTSERTVVVEEITSRSVIFTEEHAFKTEAMKLDRFLEKAADPLRAEHARLMDGLLHAMHDLPSDSSTGKTLMVLRDTALYLLERMPPMVQPYVDPVAPAPKVEPMAASTIAALTEAFAKPETSGVAEPIEDLAPTAPACVEVEGCTEEYRRIARDFAVSDDEPRSLKRRRL